MLTPLQLKDVCLLGGGAKECRYLGSTMNGECICYKKSPNKKKIIDDQVAEFVKKVVDKGGDPEAMGRGLGNHCQGYYPLVTLPQGYDIKDS